MKTHALWTVALLAVGCTTTPLAPVPQPLPEALEWELPRQGGAFLGLQTEENGSGALDDLFFRPGVRVVHVVANSPAQRAGLRVNDVVLGLDGTTCDDPGALGALVASAGAGEQVLLRVQRADTVFEVPVVLALSEADALEPPRRVYRLDPARSRAGWSTTPDGVRLVSSAEDGPFPRAGVSVGSTLLELEGRPVSSDRELVRRLQACEPGQDVRVRFRAPDSEVDTATVTLQEVPRRLTGVNLLFLVDYEAEPDASASSLSILDLWVFELFQYRREGQERRWVFLELFGFDLFSHSSDVGLLTE